MQKSGIVYSALPLFLSIRYLPIYNPLLGQSLLSPAGTANLKIFDKLTSDQDLQTDSIPIYSWWSWMLIERQWRYCNCKTCHKRHQCNGGTTILAQRWLSHKPWWIALLESGEGRWRKTHFETKSSTNKRSLVFREIIQIWIHKFFWGHNQTFY